MSKSMLSSEVRLGEHPFPLSSLYKSIHSSVSSFRWRSIQLLILWQKNCTFWLFEKHERTHTAEEQFTCLQCGKKFAIFGDLKQHKRSHAGEEPYSCSHCDKKFALLANLKQHERIHIGEKPFSCSNTDPQQHSPKQQEPFQQKSPHSSPPFHGWNPVECKLDRNKSQYETDEEEFEDLNEGFWEPPSTLVTPRKRPADDDYASSSRNCRPRLDWTYFCSKSFTY